MKSEVVGHFIENFAFLEKRPLAGRFSKFRSERIHRGTDPRIVCTFRAISRPEIGKVVRYLPHQKKQIFRLTLALASARIAPKICQRHTVYSNCPKFHPNRFTSGGV